jgi:hypothetical protein
VRNLSIAVALAFAALALPATSATADPMATVDFSQLTQCQPTITSTKGISKSASAV